MAMKPWTTNQTLLLVGEDKTEEAFLQHVKGLYAPRGCGLTVKIKNAHGKGAKHVVEWTIGQMGIAHHDAVAVLLDTDQDWSEAVAKKARGAKITVLKSEPLFEAMMLRLIGQSDNGDSNVLKSRFAPFVGNDACKPDNYGQYFDRSCLEAKRISELTIDALLRLFKKPD